jgi:glycosyltransferase involved in cell wall biosynthesis
MENIVSVIIPVYNGEKTIRQTIESVLNQSFSLIEVIVINDGSTDRTLEIVNSIIDSRLKTFSYNNAGTSVSRNRGLSHASGDFVAFIDADDLWTSNKIELQLKALEDNSQANVAYSWTDYIDLDGKFFKPGRRPTNTGDVYSKMLLYNFLENGSNPLVRKESFTKVGYFEQSCAPAEDWDMWLRLAGEYEFVAVPEVQILYRVTMNSLSTNLKRQEAASLKVIERAFLHPKAESLQHLKKRTLAEIYQYLMFKALEAPAQKHTSGIATQFFWHCLRYNPAFLKQIRLTLVVIWKIFYLEMRYQLNCFHGFPESV